LPEFSQLARKKSNKSDLQEKALHVNSGVIFSNQSILGAIFAEIFSEFVKVLKDFARIL